MRGYLTMRDAGGNTYRYGLDMRSSSYTLASGDLQALADRMPSVSNAAVGKVSMSSVLADNGALGAPGSQVENLAALSCVTEGGHIVEVLIPAPRIEIFQAATGALANVVDITNADLVTWFLQLRDTANYSDGERLADLLSGKRVHRASRRG